ncbi:MAG: putative PurR-regulated permease PerM, partial [Verrucomicrobiales bacterium]
PSKSPVSGKKKAAAKKPAKKAAMANSSAPAPSLVKQAPMPASDASSTGASGAVPRFLNPHQKSVIGTALTLASLAVILFILLSAFRYIVGFFSTFSSVFMPLLVAGLIALILRPYYSFIVQRLRFPPIIGVLTVFVTVLLPFMAFIWFFGALAVGEISALSQQLPKLVDETRAWLETTREDQHLRDFIIKYEVVERAKTLITTRAGLIAEGLQRLVWGTVSVGASAFSTLIGFFNWFVMPIYLVFMFMAKPYHKEDIEGLMPFLNESTRRNVIYLGEEFIKIIVTFFRGQLLIALAQGVLYAIGFSLVGLNYGFVLGLMLGFLNIIPYLGSMIGLAIALPLAFFQPDGGGLTLGLVVAVFLIVQNIEGYVLTPKIMGDKTGLHPMAIMVALFFWGTALGGIVGMILAIPLTAFLVVVWRLLKQEYIQEVF